MRKDRLYGLSFFNNIQYNSNNRSPVIRYPVKSEMVLDGLIINSKEYDLVSDVLLFIDFVLNRTQAKAIGSFQFAVLSSYDQIDMQRLNSTCQVARILSPAYTYPVMT
ncbi:hypothetical protein ABKN59_004922 [Abortiporus biennis]